MSFVVTGVFVGTKNKQNTFIRNFEINVLTCNRIERRICLFGYEYREDVYIGIQIKVKQKM